uniref:inorganic diphosphatase n=1 Tax=Haptolina brevifila TaxID=156173 RepID=A0A7S2HSX9_9EUKA|eukprot:CAMPEP_0174705360 /NCGR_PEP_ID=MMETSP1094-20130205/8613_1 /TAXON_ID=156173 /ORGANISM="Chrysochromulina brevifilum, Strain UTEX LB 985" /LENGTH=356 /DNA_ID=CAMNT_0015903517 /DNA_START=33 /DNA_END=1103 /DNA_ORIENTATION=-
MARAFWSAVISVFLLSRSSTGASVPVLSVFGHKIPDTDAICAALVYAWELEQRGIPARAYRLGELNRETEYVLKALGVEPPPLLDGALDSKQHVAIVDTNNPDELPEGVQNSKIHSIIDHHKLCGLKTNSPLELDVRPLCSTGSILYERSKAGGRTPPPTIAGLMLSCILSDSLEFRSPTTTARDKELAQELAQISGIDLHAHAVAMLNAKAEISHLSPDAVVMMDSKVFEIGGRKMRISVVETTRPERALEQREALVAAQRRIAEEQQLDEVLLFIVDVLNEHATFLSSSPTASSIVENAWGVTVDFDGTCVLPGVLSRKKQIIPTLEAGAANPVPPKGENIRMAATPAARVAAV